MMEAAIKGLLVLCLIGSSYAWPAWNINSIPVNQAAIDEELRAPKPTTPMPIVTHQLSFNLQRKTSENGGKKHTGADLWVTLYGNRATSDKVHLTPNKIDFEPGLSYTFLVATGKELGEVQSVVLFWNPNTWFWTSTQYLWLQGNINLRNLTAAAGYRIPWAKMEEQKDFHTTIIR